MQAVHFGAGSIGRGFIGDLLHESGYAITFVETNTVLNEQINQTHSYDLYVIEDEYRRKTIRSVTALSPLTQRGDVIRALARADVITTAVWAEKLPNIAAVLAEGLLAREAEGGRRLNVIVCENALWNGTLLREALLADGRFDMIRLDAIAAFPSTAVDRLVLNDTRDGQCVVNVGIDHELVIEQNRLTDPTDRPLAGAVYTTKLRDFLERKLFIINGGHAWAGYIGWVYGHDIVQDVFRQPALSEQVRASMGETATLLARKTSFSAAALHDYIDFACRRFAIPEITDTVMRVCRSPIRKLAPNDRLVAPAVQCQQAGLPHDHLVSGIAAALLFDHPGDPQAVMIQNYLQQYGPAAALERYSGIMSQDDLHKKIIARYDQLNEIKIKYRR